MLSCVFFFFSMLYKVGVTLKSVNETLVCDHSVESYWTVLSRGTVYNAVKGAGSNVKISVDESLVCDHSIGHVRDINILTWLRGFQDKLLSLVVFSLYPSLFWKLRDKRNLTKLQFLPESLGSMLEYWYYIERDPLKAIEQYFLYVQVCVSIAVEQHLHMHRTWLWHANGV